MNYEQKDTKTRAELAREALMAAMPKDYYGNLGLNESYRQGLDDMVAWIDLGHEPPFTNIAQDMPPKKDELFDRAVQIVRTIRMEKRAINAHFLRKEMGISYGRASSLIDQLEESGIISSRNGFTPRRVL